jgi:hypothetical protein
MPAEAAQLKMADLNDWFGNFNGESIGHEQGPADVLAEEFQPAEDVDVAPTLHGRSPTLAGNPARGPSDGPIRRACAGQRGRLPATMSGRCAS